MSYSDVGIGIGGMAFSFPRMGSWHECVGVGWLGMMMVIDTPEDNFASKGKVFL